MAWLACTALIGLWIVGSIGDVGGNLLHLLLVAALLVAAGGYAADRRALR